MRSKAARSAHLRAGEILQDLRASRPRPSARGGSLLLVGGGQRGGVGFLSLPADVGGAVHGFGGPGRLRIHGDDAAVEEPGFFGDVRGRVGDVGLLLEIVGRSEEDEVAVGRIDVHDALVEHPAGDGLGLAFAAEDGNVGLAGVGRVGVGEDLDPLAAGHRRRRARDREGCRAMGPPESSGLA